MSLKLQVVKHFRQHVFIVGLSFVVLELFLSKLAFLAFLQEVVQILKINDNLPVVGNQELLVIGYLFPLLLMWLLGVHCKLILADILCTFFFGGVVPQSVVVIVHENVGVDVLCWFMLSVCIVPAFCRTFSYISCHSLSSSDSVLRVPIVLLMHIVWFPFLVYDSLLVRLFSCKDSTTGYVNLDAGTERIARNFVDRCGLVNSARRVHNENIFNIKFAEDMYNSSSILNAIDSFLSERFGADFRDHFNFSIDAFHAMNEVYVTDLSKGLVLDAKNVGSSEGTVEKIHCDGNLPNVFGFHTFRMLICLFSDSTNTETVIIPTYTSRDSLFAQHRHCRKGLKAEASEEEHFIPGVEKAVALKTLGQYLIFDYNCQPHFVRQGAGDAGCRCLLKLHFVVFPKCYHPSIFKKYANTILIDNRLSRRTMNKTGLTSIMYNAISCIKNSIFDNSPNRNFA